MTSRVRWLFLLFVSSVVLSPAPGLSQGRGPGGGGGGAGGGAAGQLGGPLTNIEMRVWPIAGRVTSFEDGQPIAGASVRVDIGSGFEKAKTLEADQKGEFHTEYRLNAQSYPRLNVTVTVSKSGYLDGRESAAFGSAGKVWELVVMLRQKNEDPDQLSSAKLISALGPKLRASASRILAAGSARKEAKDFDRGAREFLDRHSTVCALPYLTRAVERQAGCVECRTLLGLALLDAGSLAGAIRQLNRAAGLTDAAGLPTPAQAATRPEPDLVLGVLESWRHHEDNAAAFFAHGLKLEPANPLLLLEVGRIMILEQNWQAADQNLEKAIQAGASKEAHLLRARALTEAGDTDKAQRELKGFLGRKNVKDLPASDRGLVSDLNERLDLQPGKGRLTSVLRQPIQELVRAVPTLEGLEPAASQSDLPLILRKVGESVSAFFLNFPDTVSEERIRQERLGRDGKVHQSLDEGFRYLMLARVEAWGLGLEEYRTNSAGVRTGSRGLEGGFMRTAGFASVPIAFHPSYQPTAAFRLLGRQTFEGHPTQVIAFAQLPAKAQATERFSAGSKSALILLQGIAWVEARSFFILRMRTDLLTPATEVDLERQTTEIHFREIRFKNVASALWMPREVTVTVQWKGKAFRNLHSYSDFKLFNVETQEKRKAALTPADLGAPAPD